MAYIRGVNLRSVDLNLLVVLDALLTERSVTRAARRLFMSQPATSNALRRLRLLLEDPLLLRTPAGMELTPRAAALAQPVAEMLRNVGAIFEGRKAFEPQSADLRVPIAASEYVAYVLLSPLLQRLRAAAPRLRLSVREVDAHNPLAPLYSGGVDVVCAYIPDPPSDLHRSELFADRWACVARRGHPALKSALSPNRFSRLPHVVLPRQTGGYGSSIANKLLDRGLERDIVLSVPYLLAIPNVLCTSDLVMTTPQRLATFFAKTHAIRVLPHPLRLPPFTVAAFWHARTHADPAHAWFRETLVEAAKAGRGTRGGRRESDRSK
jgi:DNA-binding transcriptional LysR family regulator